MGQKKANNRHVSFGKSRLARAALPFSWNVGFATRGSRAREALFHALVRTIALPSTLRMSLSVIETSARSTATEGRNS